MLGVHHAREWPSGEHAIEWAYELINGYKAGDAADQAPRRDRGRSSSRSSTPTASTPRARRASCSAAAAAAAATTPLNIVTSPNEYRRKNCRLLDDAAAGNCVQPSVGLREPGVDPNRNYGGFWGGPGAGTDPWPRTTAARARSPSPRRRTSGT